MPITRALVSWVINMVYGGIFGIFSKPLLYSFLVAI
jgi:hypothetical protein